MADQALTLDDARKVQARGRTSLCMDAMRNARVSATSKNAASCQRDVSSRRTATLYSHRPRIDPSASLALVTCFVDKSRVKRWHTKIKLAIIKLGNIFPARTFYFLQHFNAL